MNFKRIFLVVLDSVGIGEAKDAKNFHDEGANTLKHTIEETQLELPNLSALGLSNLLNQKQEKTKGYYTIAEPLSNGKDTLTGHLEMMGIETKKPFKTFPTGFPKKLIQELEKKTGRKVIGNCVASGTEIIERLGEEHIKTGDIIVYTSADSVLQIAAHESVIPVKELYRICSIAREITQKDEWKVGRIIARPFIGKPGSFTRTANRHDYALNPNGKTVLDFIKEKGLHVLSVGKIDDIFNHQGISLSTKTQNNQDGIKKLLIAIHKDFTGLCFVNLNDFDTKYGHRRDVLGYSKALKEFDDALISILNDLKENDLLIITADHGNDPAYQGTDHTRENVPVLIYSKQLKNPSRLPNLKTFASIGATIADNFNTDTPDIGESFLNKLQ